MQVVGAGAVGSYYGALLARDGAELTLVARGAHLDALRAQGAVHVREPDGSRWSVPARALHQPDAGADLVIVATKSHHTSEAARALEPVLGPRTPVVSLQNGVENLGRLAGVLGAARVLGGIAFVGLRITEPGTVDHQAQGWVRYGHPGGPTAVAERARALIGASWDAVLSEDIVHDQWHKLLWNAGFNAVCAITGATAGRAVATEEPRALVRAAMLEVVAVAAHHGIELTGAEVDGMAAHDPQLHDYRPSTAQDVDAGKRLERDALCGFIAREGARLGIPTPVNDTLEALLTLRDIDAGE
ncbi:MAG: 2-dehydropantoate 2-reductase [Miltoncostaeaceae bacterium]